MKYLNSLKLLISAHLIPLAVFFSVQVLLIIILNLSPQEGFSELIYSAWLIISVSALVIYLGHYFNSAMKTNWIQRLPISSLAVYSLPILILICCAILITEFYPWKEIYKAQYIFTLGLPLTGYFFINQSRSLLFGITKALLTTFAIILVWAILFWNWSMTASMIYVNLTYLILFTFTWLCIARNEVPLIAAILIATCIGVKTIRVLFSKPKTFVEAVLFLDEIPTRSNIGNFRQFTQDETLWKNAKEIDSPTFVSVLSQIFSQQYLNDTQKIKFLENISTKELETPSTTAKENKSKFALPILVTYKRTPPLGEFNVSKEMEDYMYNNWKDSRIYMSILPISKEYRYINKLFDSKYGHESIFDGYLNLYIPSRKSHFESQLEEFIKKDTKKRVLAFPFLLGLDSRENPRIKEYIENNDFEKLKPYIHGNRISALKNLPTSNQLEFTSALDKLDSEIREDVSKFICFNIKTSCDQAFDTERLSNTSWWNVVRLNGLNVIAKQSYKNWINRELKKEKNWNSIRDFLNSL